MELCSKLSAIEQDRSAKQPRCGRRRPLAAALVSDAEALVALRVVAEPCRHRREEDRLDGKELNMPSRIRPSRGE